MITTACFIEWKGLVAGHGYIVKDFVKVMNADGTSHKLVKLRNPYKTIGDVSLKGSSHGDWTGQFSKDDTKSWTDSTKTRAKYAELKTGEFFMTIEDFKQGFKYYTLTYLHTGWKTSFIEKRSSVNRRLYKFNFTITEDDYNTFNKVKSFTDTQVEDDLQDNSNVQLETSTKTDTLLSNLSKDLRLFGSHFEGGLEDEMDLMLGQ